jgi:hypothetical protein
MSSVESGLGVERHACEAVAGRNCTRTRPAGELPVRFTTYAGTYLLLLGPLNLTLLAGAVLAWDCSAQPENPFALASC